MAWWYEGLWAWEKLELIFRPKALEYRDSVSEALGALNSRRNIIMVTHINMGMCSSV